MTDPPSGPAASYRRAVYAVLIIVSTAAMVGRVARVESPREGPGGRKTPFLSANDRSRWCTVRALVDERTFAIDGMIEGNDRNWKTIDRVRHRGRDGKWHSYSSKPPLFPCLLALQYLALQAATGATLESHPFYVGRILLLTTNVAPLVIYFLLLARLVERLGGSDWGRLYVMSAATFGTFLTTFAVTINNHLPAAVSALIAAYAGLRITCDDRRQLRYFIVAGFFAALTAANELPALCFLVLLGAVLLWRHPGRTLAGYLPAAAVVAAAFFATNLAAHGSWRPPYMHRQDGPVLLQLAAAEAAGPLDRGRLPEGLPRMLAEAGVDVSAERRLTVRRPGRRWVLDDRLSGERLAITREGDRIEVRRWDNWYDYEGSYWTASGRQGVDRGERSVWVYAFHVLLGHHGILSLTPVWLLSLGGTGILLGGRDRRLRSAAALVAACTLVCLVFYITRDQPDRNYGGVSCGFRWMFWFTPLWLLAMLPAADAIAGRGRWRPAALLLLGVSVMSAAYAPLNPWSHPWLYRYWESLGWLSY